MTSLSVRDKQKRVRCYWSQIDPTQLRIFHPVGSGTFSTVYRGRIFGIDVAVKRFKEEGKGDQVPIRTK